VYTIVKHKGTNLGRNHNIIPIPSEVLNRAAHDLLRLALRIALSAVEEVDASIECSLEARKRVVVANVTAIGQPTTEGDGRDLETALAHEAVLHLGEVFGDLDFRHVGGAVCV
jgi:hypothetical protein